MAYYSEDLLEEVRSRSDVVDVIGGYVHLTKKGSTYFGLCPFHAEKTASFSVSPNKQMFYCFGCHAGGDVFKFVQLYENFTYREAIELLADRAGVELPKQELTPEKRREADKRERLLEINREAAKYFYALLRSPRGKRAYDYFKGRELSDETMQKFGLGYSDQYSDDLYKYLKKKGYEDEILKESGLVSIDEARGGHDKFWNRAMFPIQDVRGRVIGFGGRVMGEGEPKYLNSPETKIFDKSRNLYGLYIARSTKRPYLLLCEGYMDVIALHQAGFDNAVASLGTAFTEGHANLIRKYTKEVYLTFDGDGAGINAAVRAIPMFREAGIATRVVRIPKEMDNPDDPEHPIPLKDPDGYIKKFGAEGYEELIKNAQNSFMFLVWVESRKHNLAEPDSQMEFFRVVARMLTQFQDELERNIYIREVAKDYDVSESDLKKMVLRIGEQVGIAAREEKPRTSVKKAPQEDGMRKSQKLLLSWLVENTNLYAVIKGKITPDDFTDPLCRTAAAMLFEQFEKGEAIAPAKILSAFPEDEEQQEIAGIFNTAIHKVESREDMEKAIKETILRIKENSMKARSENQDPTDMAAMMQLIQDKKDLETLEKMVIHLD